MMNIDNEPKTPFNVLCKKCDHNWTVAYMPMEAGLFAKVCMKAHCPMCGATKHDIAIPITPPVRKLSDQERNHVDMRRLLQYLRSEFEGFTELPMDVQDKINVAVKDSHKWFSKV